MQVFAVVPVRTRACLEGFEDAGAQPGVEVDLAQLSARHEVSRMTVREAMKTLEAQQILSVERGRGTFVNPLSRWASL